MVLIDRTYTPSDSDILYHYCSPESFLALCSSKKLRFSDVFSMNDSLEMHWGYHAWRIAASNTIATVGKELLDDIDEIISCSSVFALPLAACFSRSRDILSQWRAYSADGEGFSVGFNAAQLLEMAARPLVVEYNLQNQIDEIKRLILAIHEVESKEAQKRGEGFFEICARLALDLVSYKNPAFAEETEVRLVHVVNFQRQNDALKLVDAGGTSFGEAAALQAIQFRMRKSTPVAYMDIDFSNDGKANPIVEVMLGPKNYSLPSGISVMLGVCRT